MKALPPNSVGVVVPETARFGPIDLQCGIQLPHFEIVYETYGKLNDDRSNAILICHALSGHHHAAGFHSMDDDKPGWWDVCIGPGKAIDTDRYFVVSLNNLGGCHGSTGPRSIDPATGDPYGPTFPTVTVKDWVRTQVMLADTLGIETFAAIAGGSLGGDPRYCRLQVGQSQGGGGAAPGRAAGAVTPIYRRFGGRVSWVV